MHLSGTGEYIFVNDVEMMPNPYVTLINERRASHSISSSFIYVHFRCRFSHFTSSKWSSQYKSNSWLWFCTHEWNRQNRNEQFVRSNSFFFFCFHFIMNRNRNKCVHRSWTCGANRFIYYFQTKSNRRWIRFFFSAVLATRFDSWMDLRRSWIICNKKFICIRFWCTFDCVWPSYS